jgi:hypothetical protein
MGDRRMGARGAVFLTLLTALIVPSGLLLSYWVLRDVPDVDCFQTITPPLQQEIDEYRRGATPIHVLGGVVVAVALGILSSERRAQAGLSRRPGWPTAFALAIYAGYLAAILTNRDVAEEPGWLLGWLAILTGPIALILAGITLFLIRRGAGNAAATAAAATAWVVALTLIPGELGLILNIDDPLCLD